VIPGQERDEATDRVVAGRRHEVAGVEEDDRIATLDRDGDQPVRRLPPGVVRLLHAEDPAGRDDAVGIPPGLVARRDRRDRVGRVAWVEPPDALVAILDEEQRLAVEPPRATAVLVDPGAGRVIAGQHVDRGAVDSATHDLGAPLLGGTGLGPPDGLAAVLAPRHADLAEPDRRLDDQLGTDPRRPGAAGDRVAHRSPKRSASRRMPSPRSSSPRAKLNRA
jgi:hypothetical protein